MMNAHIRTPWPIDVNSAEWMKIVKAHTNTPHRSVPHATTYKHKHEHKYIRKAIEHTCIDFRCTFSVCVQYDVERAHLNIGRTQQCYSFSYSTFRPFRSFIVWANGIEQKKVKDKQSDSNFWIRNKWEKSATERGNKYEKKAVSETVKSVCVRGVFICNRFSQANANWIQIK